MFRFHVFGGVHLAHVFGRNTRSTRISDIFHCLKIVLQDSRIHFTEERREASRAELMMTCHLYSQNLRWSSHIRAMNEFKQSHSNVQEKAPLNFEQFHQRKHLILLATYHLFAHPHDHQPLPLPSGWRNGPVGTRDSIPRCYVPRRPSRPAAIADAKTLLPDGRSHLKPSDGPLPWMVGDGWMKPMKPPTISDRKVPESPNSPKIRIKNVTNIELQNFHENWKEKIHQKMTKNSPLSCPRWCAEGVHQ